MAAGNPHLSAQQPTVTVKTATVITWPITQYQMTAKTNPSKMHISGSDRRISVSIDKLCITPDMFKCSLPVTPEVFLS